MSWGYGTPNSIVSHSIMVMVMVMVMVMRNLGALVDLSLWVLLACDIVTPQMHTHYTCQPYVTFTRMFDLPCCLGCGESPGFDQQRMERVFGDEGT